MPAVINCRIFSSDRPSVAAQQNDSTLEVDLDGRGFIPSNLASGHRNLVPTQRGIISKRVKFKMALMGQVMETAMLFEDNDEDDDDDQIKLIMFSAQKELSSLSKYLFFFYSGT